MNEKQDETTRTPSEVPAPWERQLSPLEDQTYSSSKLQDHSTHRSSWSGMVISKGPWHRTKNLNTCRMVDPARRLQRKRWCVRRQLQLCTEKLSNTCIRQGTTPTSYPTHISILNDKGGDHGIKTSNHQTSRRLAGYSVSLSIDLKKDSIKVKA